MIESASSTLNGEGAVALIKKSHLDRNLLDVGETPRPNAASCPGGLKKILGLCVAF